MFLGRKIESAKLDRNKDVTLCNDEITFTMSMRDDIPWHCALMNVVKWQTWYKASSKLFDSVRHALRGRWKTQIIFDKLKSSLQWTCSLPQRGLQAGVSNFFNEKCASRNPGFQIAIFFCSAALKWNCFNFACRSFQVCALWTVMYVISTVTVSWHRSRDGVLGAGGQVQSPGRGQWR